MPALSIKAGEDFLGRPAGWGKAEDERYNSERYHRPSDRYRSSFTYEGLVQEVRVTLRVALAVANATALPQWLPSADFHRVTAPLRP